MHFTNDRCDLVTFRWVRESDAADYACEREKCHFTNPFDGKR